MRQMRLAPALLALAVLAGACTDSVIRQLQPGNDEMVTATADSFAYIASNLENVSDKREFVWTNSEPRVQFNHESFLPHGYGLVIIHDAVGVVVDSTILDYQLVTESRAGVPGLWTVTLIYTGAFGRAQFSLVPLPADAVPATARPAAAPAVEASAANRRTPR